MRTVYVCACVLSCMAAQVREAEEHAREREVALAEKLAAEAEAAAAAALDAESRKQQQKKKNKKVKKKAKPTPQQQSNALAELTTGESSDSIEPSVAEVLESLILKLEQTEGELEEGDAVFGQPLATVSEGAPGATGTAAETKPVGHAPPLLSLQL